MSESPYSGEPAPTIEQGLSSLVDDAKKKFEVCREDCEKRIVESPLKAVALGVAAGYLLHRLPLRAILVAKLRVISALAPPALFAYGAAKVCEYLQKEARKP